MNFLPTENITYKSKLSEDEILKRLSRVVKSKKLSKYDPPYGVMIKSYKGEVNDHVFDIRRIISYRNSFLPRISGVIEKDFDSTIIKVKMRLHTFVIFFACVWCCGVGIACVVSLIELLGNSEFDPHTLIPFAMIIFGYSMTLGAFKFESYKSKKELQKIFEAEIIEG